MRTRPAPNLPSGLVYEELLSEERQAGRHSADRVRRLGVDVATEGFATQQYAQSAVVVELDLELSDAVEYLGFAFTQFAMPVVAGASFDFDFQPAHNLRSPRAVLPLLACDGGRSVLLAPLTNPHEQVITFDDGTLRWGWHGDLDEVPAGITSDLGVYLGERPADLLERWADDLHAVAAVTRRERSANPVTSRLSYWTDNGAAYWYRTEAGRTIVDSVIDKIDELRADQVPVGAVELDSWFYRHETPRAISEFGYPEEVPPSGAMQWLPRPDAFPPSDTDPMEGLAARTAPLVLHARHISPRSPHVDDT